MKKNSVKEKFKELRNFINRNFEEFIKHELDDFTPYEILAVEDIIRRSLPKFCMWVAYHEMATTLSLKPFHYKIMHELLKAHYGKYEGLIINIPPGYSKTWIASNFYPAWSFFNNPDCRFLHLSFNSELVNENSDNVKKILKSDCLRPMYEGTDNDIEFSKTTDGKKFWKINKKGQFIAFSTGGQVTGRRAGQMGEFEESSDIDELDSWDGEGLAKPSSKGKFIFNGCILIDDPLKPDDANSQVLRAKVNNRWSQTIRSRRATSRTPVICVMQRLHENDFTDVLLKDDSIKWKLLVIPAISEDEHGNEHALWPEKEGLEYLKKIRNDSPSTFYTQYMQKPVPEDGVCIKREWFRRYMPHDAQDFEYRVIFADTAFKKGQNNDYNCFMHVGMKHGDIYILDIEHFKSEVPEMERRAIQFLERHREYKDGSIMRSFYVEDKASGIGLAQKMAEKRMPLQKIPRNGRSKGERFGDISTILENGFVMLPHGNYEWVDNFLAECMAFSGDLGTHAHDDQVDCLIDACLYTHIKIGFKPRANN